MAARILAQADGITPASRHSDYINRRESFTAKGGCIYTAHHLPKWANNNPKAFFAAADKYERANGTRYREIEFALPNELNTAAQKEIIDTFIEHHLKDHYYAYAIHDKIGIMSNGEHNTHVHIMFSEREMDDVEKKAERSAELFFHRANSKHPERGGCPKAGKWNNKNRARYLCEMRRDFAEIQNSVLKKYNVNAQVDHRSLKAQYEDALKKGDLDAALLLNRLPEEHLGPALAADKHNTKVINLMEYRAYKFQRSQLSSMIDNLKVEHGASFAQNAKDNASKAFADHELHFNNAVHRSSELATLKDRVNSDYQALLALEKVMISKETAHDMAIAHLLPASDLAIIRAQKKLTLKQDELKTLRTSLLESGTSAASDDIIQCLTEDILHQQERQNLLSAKYDEIQARLTAQEVQKQLASISQEILRADKPQQQEYWHLIQKLNQDTQLLQNEMDKEIIGHIGNFLSGSGAGAFTSKDISHYLDNEERCLKRTLRQKISELDNLKKRLISPERATLIAKSRYLNGADKQLRLDMRNLQKESDRISAAANEYASAQADFATMPKPKWYQSSDAYNEAMSHVKSMEDTLQQRQQDFAHKQARLEKMQSRLEQKCSTPAAKSSIAHTAARIIQKNKTNVAKVDELSKSIQQLQRRLSAITNMKAAIKAGLILERPIKIHKENTGGTSARRCMEDVAHSLVKPHHSADGGLSVMLNQQDNRDFTAMDETEREAQSEIAI
ncbi:putative plasmid mobilization protein [Selenomonas ruminantium subsp. lactilytica TAM6421]|uniref:Putative plasmid mobilization protein n=2 Tax=Selenomonas ruminantium TaxID=971 RepID=I0GQR3_SELRL|nr:putative plasmid mobilization protein [Selenomonas ruminantium subsp. lactilytica TAM6421]